MKKFLLFMLILNLISSTIVSADQDSGIKYALKLTGMAIGSHIALQGIQRYVYSDSLDEGLAISFGILSAAGLYCQYKKHQTVQAMQLNREIRDMYRRDLYSSFFLLAMTSLSIGIRSTFTPTGMVAISGLANLIIGCTNLYHHRETFILNSHIQAYNVRIQAYQDRIQAYNDQIAHLIASNGSTNSNPITTRHSEPSTDCPICFRSYASERSADGTILPVPFRTTFQCGHMACQPCTLIWIRTSMATRRNPTCPSCETPISGAERYLATAEAENAIQAAMQQPPR